MPLTLPCHGALVFALNSLSVFTTIWSFCPYPNTFILALKPPKPYSLPKALILKCSSLPLSSSLPFAQTWSLEVFVFFLKPFTLPRRPSVWLCVSPVLKLISLPCSKTSIHGLSPKPTPFTILNNLTLWTSCKESDNPLLVSPSGRTTRWLWSRWAQWRRPSSPSSSSTITTWERTTTCGSPSPSPQSEPQISPLNPSHSSRSGLDGAHYTPIIPAHVCRNHREVWCNIKLFFKFSLLSKRISSEIIRASQNSAFNLRSRNKVNILSLSEFLE